MRSVRRGLVATAIAFPLAFGFAGVATAGENGEGSVDWAEFEANFTAASVEGAGTGELESEALQAEFEKDGKKKDGDKRSDGKDEDGEKEISYAEYEAEGAAADATGAAVGEVESASGVLDD